MNKSVNKAGVTKRFSVWRTAVWLCPLLFLCLYVLSIGPVLRAVHHSRGSGWVKAFVPTLEVIYTPVKWLHDRTPLRKPIESYLD